MTIGVQAAGVSVRSLTKRRRLTRRKQMGMAWSRPYPNSPRFFAVVKVCLHQLGYCRRKGND